MKKVTLEKARKLLLEKDFSFLENQLILSSLYSIAWEMLKNSIRQRLEGFFSDDTYIEEGEIKHKITDEYIYLFEGQQQLDKQLKVLLDFKAINQDDIKFIHKTRQTRNDISHRLAYFILDDDWPVIELDWIIKIRDILHKFENWWIRNVEADYISIIHDIKPEDIDFDQAESLQVKLLNIMIRDVKEKKRL